MWHVPRPANEAPPGGQQAASRPPGPSGWTSGVEWGRPARRAKRPKRFCDELQHGGVARRGGPGRGHITCPSLSPGLGPFQTDQPDLSRAGPAGRSPCHRAKPHPAPPRHGSVTPSATQCGQSDTASRRRSSRPPWPSRAPRRPRRPQGLKACRADRPAGGGCLRSSIKCEARITGSVHAKYSRTFSHVE